ncbi:MAG: bifunctional DNA primase/polymerase [Actinomycetota bacterium]|nr:bifunctional DNA primase/polymerase [Actinomycetota bacterium]
MTEALSAALGYAHRGWRVFPLQGIADGACTCKRDECSSPGKHPLVRRGLYEGTTDTTKIQSWWHRWPHANIGIATGPDSGLIVIDVDLPKAEASLQRLEELRQQLTPTLTARTGGGGLHLYFRHPERTLPNTTGRLPGLEEALPGIDVRAEGGYVVAPPSDHISSGKSCGWTPTRR